MSKDELISKQQLAIEHYKAEQSENQESKDNIQRTFVCIGGPLNDNNLQFNKEQLAWLRKIYSMVSELDFCEPT